MLNWTEYYKSLPFDEKYTKLLEILDNCHLTGSQRYFGKGNDYDFLANYRQSLEILIQLDDLEIKKISPSKSLAHKRDPNSFAFEIEDLDFNNYKIDIVVKKDKLDYKSWIIVDSIFKKLGIPKSKSQRTQSHDNLKEIIRQHLYFVKFGDGEF